MRWVLLGGVAIVVFDTVMALAARTFGFEYGSPPGIAIATAIYFLTAFLAARQRGMVRTGGIVGAGVALVDATVGWAVSWAIGPGASPAAYLTPEWFAVIAVFVVALGAVVGLGAGWLAVRWTRSRST
jgi:hypothetical protein